MKQLNLFDQSTKSEFQSEWVLYSDGASRNNPGLAGAGIYLLKDGQTVSKEGFFLGIKTNNQAEYLGLLLGLFFLKQYADVQDRIRIISDSELLVKQLKGQYKVRNPELQLLYKLAHTMLKEFQMYDIIHVVRADNIEADALANQGIDKKILVPKAFSEMLSTHGISL